jgi:outer membrane cobalamin receptor
MSLAALSAQTIDGHVCSIDAEGKHIPLPGAVVYFSDTRQAVSANSEGVFRIKRTPSVKTAWLVASYLGFENDSVLVEGDGQVEFALVESGAQLIGATVMARQRGTYFSRMAPQKVEVISKAGLMKMACCNLSESFENSATVTVGFTDAVSGAKQVQLLGLSGIYSQMLDENIPTMRGLAGAFGWSYTPGPWLESIQISKGASSVLNGYESVSGQINLEFKQPHNSDQLFVNLYGDESQRFEANLTAAGKIAPKLYAGLLLHASTENAEHDSNRDGFMDTPKTKLINAYNRWYYENPELRLESRTGLRFLYETREGGQHSGMANHLYKSGIENKNFNISNKTGFSVGQREGQSLGIINSFTYHRQDSDFGMKYFGGSQSSYYGNILFSSHIANTSHKYTVGASLAYDNYETNYSDRLPSNDTPLTSLNRTETVPGIFAQYTYSYLEKFMLILGARSDYNSRYGWLFTPRANLKYNFTDNVIARVSAGRGYRSPDAIADNIGLMASSRNFDAAAIKGLGVEKAWNYGGNLTFYLPFYGDRKITLSADYFRTDFQNQMVADMERNPRNIFFYDLAGKSYANAWQIDLSFEAFEGFDIFAAFRYNDAKITLSDGAAKYLLEKPLTSRYRGLLNLSYATRFKKWVVDFTAQLNGPARLPSMNGYSTDRRESPVFPVYFAQLTKNTKRFDVYLGCENIFDFRQNDPIINPQNPFADDFDSSIIWGPLMGRRIYAGIRLRIGEL